jgi:uncharacterized protein (TIGR02246 family)
MPQHSPAATVRTFVAAMNRGDLDAALDCYAPDAVFVAEPGQALRDRSAIREALGGMLSMQPTLVTATACVFESGDTALYHGAWTMTGSGPEHDGEHDGERGDGEHGGREHGDIHTKTVRMEGRSSDVLRRFPDGRWMIVVDNPWGTAVIDPAA